jgi:hypothetical protein
MSVRALSRIQTPGESNYGTETDNYEGPVGSTSYQKEYRTSAQQATQFKTRDIQEQYHHPLALSSQTRSGIFQWASAPSFNQD